MIMSFFWCMQNINFGGTTKMHTIHYIYMHHCQSPQVPESLTKIQDEEG
jgi:hypothetical protein